jgi:hypothetical protein
VNSRHAVSIIETSACGALDVVKISALAVERVCKTGASAGSSARPVTRSENELKTGACRRSVAVAV